jgi:pilus assembly protein Flp/PilA
MTKLLIIAKSYLNSLLKHEEGATMVEYGLMLALIAAVCVGTVALIGTGANTTFTTISGKL